MRVTVTKNRSRWGSRWSSYLSSKETWTLADSEKNQVCEDVGIWYLACKFDVFTYFTGNVLGWFPICSINVSMFFFCVGRLDNLAIPNSKWSYYVCLGGYLFKEVLYGWWFRHPANQLKSLLHPIFPCLYISNTFSNTSQVAQDFFHQEYWIWIFNRVIDFFELIVGI